MGWSGSFSSVALSHFFVQFVELFPDQRKHFSAGGGQSIILSRACPLGAFAASQPSISCHAVEQRVKRTRADLVSVAAQFPDNPLTMNRGLTGIVQNVHLPESEKNFASGCFQVLR